MSNQKHTIILGGLFAHAPCDLKQRMRDAGALDGYTYNFLQSLYAHVDLSQKTFVTTIEDDDGKEIDVYTYAGNTIEVSYETLAEDLMCERKAHHAAKKLKDANLLSWKKGKNANIYHIHIYDQLIEEARANPDTPKIKRLLAVEPTPEQIESRKQEAIKDAGEADTAPDAHPTHVDHAPDAPQSENTENDTACDAPRQPVHTAPDAVILELIQEEPPPPTVTTPVTGRGGDFLNSQTPKTEPATTSLPAASPGPGLDDRKKNSLREKDNDESLFLNQPLNPVSHSTEDIAEHEQRNTPNHSHPVTNSKSPPSPAARDVVPNGYIADAIDFMIDEKTMNGPKKAKEPDPDEDFVRAFYEQPPAVVDYKDLRRAQNVRQMLIEKLTARGIDLPPLRLFKKIMEETKARVEQGEVRPKYLNFFLDTPTGKEIVDFCIDKLHHENRAQSDKEKTKALLQEMRQPRSSPGGKGSLSEGIESAKEPWLKEMLERVAASGRV